ncbi:hypothetical protein C806_03161 [Lachnospiraceae bacterium 3-1]|nr:hypothetical protein C806_03161 [Lachnospiraceae bacterium 3-1]
MNLLNYLVTALSISVIMTLIPFILGYRNKGNEGKRKGYWKLSCVFGGITVALGVVALVLMLPFFQ